MTDYYAVLGISEDSDITGINKAYRQLALKWHPDRNPSDDAAQKFNKVAEAFETLSHPAKRKKYDQRRQKSAAMAGTKVLRFTSDNANDVFEKIFGKTNIEEIIKQATGKAGREDVVHHNQPRIKIKTDVQRRSKVKVEVKEKPEPEPVKESKKREAPIPQPEPVKQIPEPEPVTESGKPILCPLEDLYNGKRRIVKLEGYTKIVIAEIPIGCHDGYQLPVKNPENGEITYFTVHARKHPVYWRTKDNLHMNYDLTLKELVNGFTAVITLLNGKKKKISHKYSGKTVGPELVMKVPTLGMPKYNSSEYGDLYVHFKVKLPLKI